MDFYDTLGVERSATAEDIKNAFRKKASAAHPDRAGGSSDVMTELNQAYEVLGNLEKRRRYDETGSWGLTPDVYQQAETLIMTMFSRCMLSRISGSLVWQVKQGLGAELASLHGQVAQMMTQKELFQARAKTVKAKEKNLAQMVADHQIQALDKALEQKVEQIAIFEKALEIIEDYEDIEPEK